MIIELNSNDLIERCYDDCMGRRMPYGFWPNSSDFQQIIISEIDELCQYLNKKFPNNIYGFHKSFIYCDNKKFAVLPDHINLNGRKRKFQMYTYQNCAEFQEDCEDTIKKNQETKIIVYSISVWSISRTHPAPNSNAKTKIRLNWNITYAWG
ncbi:hypothetical protein FDI40_gp463 [Agrobacterium phage Atu_ph07]|uniref:Uncharacterized protein n=1 Tax=Agrobacterium phage Atu_ph07 TaxID=2024264 RepID=A0A2L0V075_9CAUD|nr:hypothetical protein FDI40_gp463 [Agrobacterium phage Atu_ph07]AUZ95222.1 hypothetical protein [Agrobacterium phage Atu_ph07]